VSDAKNTLIRITSEPISDSYLINYVMTNSSGAVVLFHGSVRDHSNGTRVISLEYEAYESMALAMLSQLAGEAAERWNLHRVAIVHRTGQVPIGDAAVVVAVSASHRAEAFSACAHLIDRLKEIVPIWKKELTEEGSRWIAESGGFKDPEDTSSTAR